VSDILLELSLTAVNIIYMKQTADMLLTRFHWQTPLAISLSEVESSTLHQIFYATNFSYWSNITKQLNESVSEKRTSYFPEVLPSWSHWQATNTTHISFRGRIHDTCAEHFLRRRQTQTHVLRTIVENNSGRGDEPMACVSHVACENIFWARGIHCCANFFLTNLHILWSMYIYCTYIKE
jgi:hypothetical protein